MSRPGPVLAHAAALLLALLALAAGNAMAGRLSIPPGLEDKVVEGEYVVLFEDAEPDAKGKAAALARKFEKDFERTDDGWELIKGFAFRCE